MCSGAWFDDGCNFLYGRMLDLADKVVTDRTEVVAHMVYVTFIVTVAYEMCKGVLLDARYRTGIEAEFFQVSFNQCGRKHHEADTERRNQGFGKGVHVDHFAFGIH